MSDTIRGKVLITGASGFIGSWLRDRLLEEGSDVLAIRRPGSPEAKTGRSVEASYDDVASLERLMDRERPDYVLHVAGATKGRTYQDFEAGNVMPTENLLRAVASQHPGLKRFVHVSSLAAYGPGRPGAPLRESDPRRPVEFYGESKLAAERVVEGANVPYTIIRPSGVYGPRDVDMFELFKLARSRVNLFFGNRRSWGSFVYVDDVVDAILRVPTVAETEGRGYFLSDGEPITWETLQADILSVVGRRALTVSLPRQMPFIAGALGELATRVDGQPRLMNRQKAIMGAQEAWTCHADAAAADFGFAPSIGRREALARTHAWYEANGWYGR
ncbi:MAG: NAD(P)-dependent oxidoreductase [Polyangiales bacterium]|nr:NAD(P)-dependent oxidoreductase [Myxococcales bacterium]MCB9657052.1 NAD(P)-dependent oxidoreductase [Sandaracinaceae bacterium]